LDENTVSNMPKIFLDKYSLLGENLEKYRFPELVKSIILEEFVFLSTHSCIVSRLKKSFKVFEETFPLINLEKVAPDRWKSDISNIKRAISQTEWIAALGLFTLSINMPWARAGLIIEKEIRLFIVDP
jgi:hypothetical protein